MLGTDFAAPMALNGLRVLVIDDCEENQYLFSRLLSRKGAEVVLASDGKEGTDKALSSHFDLVLMDIQMPVLDGYDSMALLKARHYLTPVIALTACSRDEDRARIHDVGFAAHVTKPIDMKILMGEIYKHSAVFRASHSQ